MRLAAFAGLWQIERDIDDRRAGRGGRFAGEGAFTPDADGLAYAEAGTLTLIGAPPMTATRRYRWREAGAGFIEVRFEDGRLFHRFDAEEAAPAAEHDCPPDRYRVRYDFSRWPQWQAEWRVSGPRKDYLALSRYRRAGQVP
jgi:hypothetical protein